MYIGTLTGAYNGGAIQSAGIFVSSISPAGDDVVPLERGDLLTIFSDAGMKDRLWGGKLEAIDAACFARPDNVAADDWGNYFTGEFPATVKRSRQVKL